MLSKIRLHGSSKDKSLSLEHLVFGSFKIALVIVSFIP